MAKKTADNTTATPMDYEIRRMPNLRNQRIRLAQTAEERTRAELEEEAAKLGIDTSDADTKEDVIQAVRGATSPRAAEQ